MATYGGYTNPYARGLMSNPRYARGNAMLQAGINTSPVGHWTQGLARMLQAGIGSWEMGRAEKEEEGKKKERAQKLGQALQMMNSGQIGEATALLADHDEGTAIQMGMYGQQRKDRQADTAEDRAWRREMDERNFAQQRQLAQEARASQPGPAPVAVLDTQTGKVGFVDALELRRNPGRYAPPTSGGFTIGPPGGGQGAPQPPSGVAPQNDAGGIMSQIRGGPAPATQPTQQPGEGFVYEGGLPKIVGNGMGLYRNADGSISPKAFNPDAGDGDRFKNSNTLRDEFTAQTKTYAEARAGYEKVKAAASQPSGVGDVALIFGYMKTIDPNSTVREGEFATAQDSGGVPQQIWGMYNRILKGERLTPELRADFVKQAELAFNVYQSQYNQTQQYYTGLANRYGLRPEDVLVDRGPMAPSAPPPPGGDVMPPPQAPTMDPQAFGGSGGDALPRPQSEAQFQALPSGSQFVAPDGTIRVKP